MLRELRDDEGNIIRAIEFSGDEEVDVTEREREKGRKPPPEIEPDRFFPPGSDASGRCSMTTSVPTRKVAT